jgi:glutamine synthetase
MGGNRMLRNQQNSAMNDPVSGVFQMADRHEIVMIDLKFCGLLGRWHHVTLPASRLNADLFKEGVGFDGSSVPGFAATESSDMLLLPDPTTTFLDPFWEAPTLSMICGIHDGRSGKSVRRDPRSVAARAEEYLRVTGIADRATMAPEYEFYVFDTVRHSCDINHAFYNIDSVEGAWNTGSDRDKTDLPVLGMPIHGGYHALPPSDRLYNLRAEMTALIEGAGVAVKYHHHEGGGPGQCEIEVLPVPLLLAADHGLLIKYLVRMAADRAGKVATFMPKPLYNAAGSGMHVHQALFQGDRNLFWEEEGYSGLSETALHYIGGLLEHGPALLALTNPSTNSFKRLVPGFEAPVNLIFGRGNRTAAIRIPEEGRTAETKRIEFRPGDATGNLYLTLSAMLMAGIDGIKRKIDPRVEGFGPFEIPLSRMPEEERKRIRSLPLTLGSVLDALEKDHQFLLAGEVFDEPLIQAWIELKRKESLDVRCRPHPREISLYLDV